MSFAEINLIAPCSQDWPDMPKEFPEFNEEVALPLSKTLAQRCEEQAIAQKDWPSHKIGNMSKSEIFYNGIQPVDFLRAFHDKHDDIEKVDKLLDLDAESRTGMLFYTKMGLSAQHINNQFTDQELENLCYERVGSKRWYTQRLVEKLGCNPDEIPDIVLAAIQETNIQKSLGRRSFRNYMRRINKSIAHQNTQKPKQTKTRGKKKKKPAFTKTDQNVVVSFS